jgi:thiol:disulfide interchange protein DsbA
VKFVKILIAVSLFIFSAASHAEYVAGQDYKLIEPAQPTSSGNKVEVLEFFFYGCSHCYHLHPHLSAWGKRKPKDVELVLVPTMLNPQWEPMAYTYYALEALGQQHNLHDTLYEAWNIKNTVLVNETDITDFVSRQGVDGKKFGEAYHSFGVQSKVTRSKQLSQTYRIRGTPTVIVDGKYLISSLQPEAVILVLNELVEKARKERKNKH